MNQGGPAPSSIRAIKKVFLGTAAAIVVIVIVTWFLSREGSNDDPSTSPGLFVALVAGVGVVDLLLIRLALRRTPSPGTDAQGVVTWFVSVTFLGHALAMTPFLVGFVGSFVANEWTLVLSALPFAALGLWLVAPTRRRIDAAHQQLARAGISVDVAAALDSRPVRPAGASASTRSDEGTDTRPPS